MVEALQNIGVVMFGEVAGRLRFYRRGSFVNKCVCVYVCIFCCCWILSKREM